MKVIESLLIDAGITPLAAGLLHLQLAYYRTIVNTTWPTVGQIQDSKGFAETALSYLDQCLIVHHPE